MTQRHHVHTCSSISRLPNLSISVLPSNIQPPTNALSRGHELHFNVTKDQQRCSGCTKAPYPASMSGQVLQEFSPTSAYLCSRNGSYRMPNWMAVEMLSKWWAWGVAVTLPNLQIGNVGEGGEKNTKNTHIKIYLFRKSLQLGHVRSLLASHHVDPNESEGTLVSIKMGTKWTIPVISGIFQVISMVGWWYPCWGRAFDRKNRDFQESLIILI